MDRHPKLKVCLGHAGGYVPYAVDRMDKGWEMFPKYRGNAVKPPSTYLDRFYYDTTTFTDRNLRFLVDVVGADRVVLGTDWPVPMAVVYPVNTIKNSPVLSDVEKDLISKAIQITGGNVAKTARILNIPRGTLRYKLEKYELG